MSRGSQPATARARDVEIWKDFWSLSRVLKNSSLMANHEIWSAPTIAALWIS
jgi:hypothetical protein